MVKHLTKDEELAQSLGYINVPWRRADYAHLYPRGVWKCPHTGELLTPAVISLMQKPVPEDAQPFAPTMSLVELAAEARRERREAIAAEAAAIALERAEARERKAAAICVVCVNQSSHAH